MNSASAGENPLHGIAQAEQAFIQQDFRKGGVDPLQLRAQGQLRQIPLELQRIRGIERARKTELSFLGDGANDGFPLGVNQKRDSDRSVRGGALRGINRHLPRDQAEGKKRRREFGQFLIMDGDS